MSHALTAFALVALGAFGTSACGARSEQAPPFELVVRTTDETNRPLAGALVQHEGRTLSTTAADGSALVTLRGPEGATVDLNVVCPSGHESPAKPTRITLRRLTGGDSRPEYAVPCPSMTRSIVIVVRAENGPNLPVLYLGREIARTDASGAAHAALDVRPGEMIEVTLDTQSNKQLRPESPTVALAVKQQDDIFVVDQRFTAPAPRIVPQRRRGPVPL
ncbi:hypothetical protein [Labilithrix luteola]|nr:hypothetical protein [Labilithrix luteola]